MTRGKEQLQLALHRIMNHEKNVSNAPPIYMNRAARTDNSPMDAVAGTAMLAAAALLDDAAADADDELPLELEPDDFEPDFEVREPSLVVGSFSDPEQV